ncbi:MAG: DUF3618 domain-containing protein [Acidimicrobiales bacterium]
MGTATDELSAAELRQQIDEQRGEISEDLVAIGDRVSPKRMTERKTAAVRERLAGVRDSVMGAKDSVVDKASDRGSALGDKASEAAEQVRQGPELARRGTQGNPLAAGLIAFGGGLLAATLLPSSSREQQLVHDNVQPQLEAAAGQVGVAAQETVEAVNPAVEEAVVEVKDDAQQAVAEVKDTASSAAADVAEEARSGVDEVRPR